MDHAQFGFRGCGYATTSASDDGESGDSEGQN
ncbi:MAG: hypothetical protein RLZ87_40, partial [Armatimonadota bacterium]